MKCTTHIMQGYCQYLPECIHGTSLSGMTTNISTNTTPAATPTSTTSFISTSHCCCLFLPPSEAATTITNYYYYSHNYSTIIATMTHYCIIFSATVHLLVLLLPGDQLLLAISKGMSTRQAA